MKTFFNKMSIACLSLATLAFALPINSIASQGSVPQAASTQSDPSPRDIVNNYAQALVYRKDGQCPDLFLNSRSSIASGSCTFQVANQDANMQVPLFVSQDIDTVYGSCEFIPANENSSDHIYQVLGSKSSLVSGSSTPSWLPSSSKLILPEKNQKKQQIAISVRNTNSVIETGTDDRNNKSHMNILFYATTEPNGPWGNGSYTIGDTLNCTFFSFD